MDKRERLLSVKELAFEIGRSRTYVSAMKRCGFRMPGGKATASEALKWLRRRPGFRRAGAYGIKKVF